MTSASAQISIDTSDLPLVGNVFSFAVNETDSLSAGTASATAQIWDYSTLVPEFSDTIAFIDPSQTPYQSDFPGADMSQYLPGDGTYLFLSHTANGIFSEGINLDLVSVGLNLLLGVERLSIPAIEKENFFPAPTTYPDTITANALYKRFIDKNAGDGDSLFVRRTIKTFTIDGWGTLYTPTDTFNVLRMHEYVVNLDSAYVSIPFPPVTIPIQLAGDTANNYYFLNDSIRYPVATLRNNKDGNFVNIRVLESVDPPPNANLSALNPTVLINDTVIFRNFSAGATSWFWDLGDGTTSTVNEPRHAYSATGPYTVKLAVSNSTGSDSMTRVDFVNVYDPVIADFTFTVDLLKAEFTNTSQNADSYSWTFGDTTGSFSDQNPTHLYADTGIYEVILTVTNAASLATHIDYVTILETGIEMSSPDEVTIFPNPANDVILISLRNPRSEKYVFQVFDLAGKKVLSKDILPVGNQTATVNILPLANGMYFYELRNPRSGTQLQGKLVIAR